MRVPTAYGPVGGGSGQTQKDGSRLPAWAMPLWLKADESNWNDPEKYFWCTKGRPDNDCLHSRRVGVVTGKWVPPILETNGRKILWEAEGYFGKTSPYNDSPNMIATSESDMTLSAHAQYVTLSNPHISLQGSFNYAIGNTKDGRQIRYISGSFECTLYYSGTDKTPSRVRTTCTDWSGKYSWPGKSLVESTCLAFFSGLPMYVLEKGRKVLNPLMISALQNFVPNLHSMARGFAADAKAAYDSSWRTSVTTRVDANYPSKAPGYHFLMHEPARVGSNSTPSAGSADFSNYWWNVMVQQAYLDCLQSMPRLNENSISNLLELVGFVKALVVDHRIEIPKSLQSAWLAYRYQYQTTKLDAEEAIKFVHRYTELGGLSRSISCHGSSKIQFKDVDMTCRCRATVLPKELDTFANVWRALYTYGLQPNFYVVWDMIPYSFVVDWFIPVGNLAAVADARSQYSSTNYNISRIVFSVSYDVKDDDGNIFRQYTRWAQGTPPELNGLYFLETAGPSDRVLGYRILDALSLTIR